MRAPRQRGRRPADDALNALKEALPGRHLTLLTSPCGAHAARRVTAVDEIDDEDAREALKHLLELHHANVEKFGTGRELFEYLRGDGEPAAAARLTAA